MNEGVEFRHGVLWCGTTDGIVKYFSLKDYGLIHAEKMHEDDVNQIEYHMGSNTLFTCSDDKTFKQHKLDPNIPKSPSLEKTYYGGNFFRSFTLYPPSNVAAVNWDKTIRIYKLNEEDVQSEISIPEKLNSILALPESNQMMIGGKRGYMATWDITRKQQVTNFIGHESYVNFLLKIDQTRVLSSSDDKVVRMFDMKSSRECLILKGHTSPIWTILGWDDNQVITASCDKTLRLWDLRTAKSSTIFTAHSGLVFGAVKLDDKSFISASYDKQIIVWDVEKKKEIRKVDAKDQIFSLSILLPEKDDGPFSQNHEHRRERIDFIRSLDETHGTNFLDFKIKFDTKIKNTIWETGSVNVPSSLLKPHSSFITDNQKEIILEGLPPKHLTPEMFFNVICGLDEFYDIPRTSERKMNYYYYTVAELYDLFRRLGMVSHQYILCKKLEMMDDLRGLMIIFAKSIELYENPPAMFSLSPLILSRRMTNMRINSPPNKVLGGVLGLPKEDGDREPGPDNGPPNEETPVKQGRAFMGGSDWDGQSVEDMVNEFLSEDTESRLFLQSSSTLSFESALSLTIFNILKSRQEEIRSQPKFTKFLEKLNYLSALDHHEVLQIEEHREFFESKEIQELGKLRLEVIRLENESKYMVGDMDEVHVKPSSSSSSSNASTDALQITSNTNFFRQHDENVTPRAPQTPPPPNHMLFSEVLQANQIRQLINPIPIQNNNNNNNQNPVPQVINLVSDEEDEEEEEEEEEEEDSDIEDFPLEDNNKSFSNNNNKKKKKKKKKESLLSQNNGDLGITKIMTEKEITSYQYLFSKAISEVYEKKKFTNFIVCTSDSEEGNVEIKVHKEILILRSNFYFSMFRFPGKESMQTEKVLMEFMGEKTLVSLIEFVYLRRVSSNDMRTLLKILQHSEMYFERELKDSVRKKIIHVMRKDQSNIEIMLLENGYLLKNLPDELQDEMVKRWSIVLEKDYKTLWGIIRYSKKLNDLIEQSKEKDIEISKLREELKRKNMKRKRNNHDIEEEEEEKKKKKVVVEEEEKKDVVMEEKKKKKKKKSKKEEMKDEDEDEDEEEEEEEDIIVEEEGNKRKKRKLE